MMAAVSEEDMPGLVDLDASSVHASSGLNAAVRLNASVPAPSGFLVGLPAPSVPAVGGLNTSFTIFFGRREDHFFQSTSLVEVGSASVSAFIASCSKSQFSSNGHLRPI